jgi:hypothetical protein
MEAYREIIAGSKLAEVIDLPERLKKSELEVIILPVEKKEKQTEKKQTINLEDLPKHNMGKVLSPLDRAHIYTNER